VPYPRQARGRVDRLFFQTWNGTRSIFFHDEAGVGLIGRPGRSRPLCSTSGFRGAEPSMLANAAQ
jgi:hypothetical protein